MDVDEAREKVRELKRELAELDRQLRVTMSVAYGLLGIARKLSGSEDLSTVIAQLQRVIATINMLITSITALQAASGPWGWAVAGIGAVGTAITVGEQISYGMRE